MEKIKLYEITIIGMENIIERDTIRKENCLTFGEFELASELDEDIEEEKDLLENTIIIRSFSEYYELLQLIDRVTDGRFYITDWGLTILVLS
jgi:hypothetical protein